jgi:hypothetical protein
MTAYVTIPVATAQNALKVPNAALRYNPPLAPEEIRALYAKYGITAGPSAATAADENALRTRATAERPAQRGGAETVSREARSDNAIVWKLHADKTLEPIKVALGITDHAYTEVTALLTGTLQPGDAVVTGSVLAKTSTPGQGIRR